VLSADDRDLDVLLSGEVIAAAASDASLATDRWREEGPWLLLLLLPIAALAFRRGWVLVVLVFVLPLPQPAEASLWDDLWLNKNQQAQELLRDGNAAGAVDLFDDAEWQAVARYRAGDFAASAEQFAEHGDSRNLYNLGNAMAFQGALDDAIDAYQRALEIDPDDDDAQYNLELVESLKEQQEQEQQNQGDDQQSTENSGGEGEQSDAESDPDQQGSEGNSQSQSDAEESNAPQRGDEEQSDEDLKALQQELQRAAEQAEANEQPPQPTEAELAELRQHQEQQQAMEQWLRRVPDDPGGLLRRKFRHQYQRSGVDQDGNSVWPDDEVQPW
jgi:Ca-activated chloride channel family protein